MQDNLWIVPIHTLHTTYSFSALGKGSVQHSYHTTQHPLTSLGVSTAISVPGGACTANTVVSAGGIKECARMENTLSPHERTFEWRELLYVSMGHKGISKTCQGGIYCQNVANNVL